MDITTFMNTRLQELSSQTELPELIKEAARLMESAQQPDMGIGSKTRTWT